MRRWQFVHLVASLIWVAVAATRSYDLANPWTRVSRGPSCVRSPDDTEGKAPSETEIEQIARTFDVPVQKAREDIGAFQRVLRDEQGRNVGAYENDLLAALASDDQRLCDLSAALDLSTSAAAHAPNLREAVEQPDFSMRKFRQETWTRSEDARDEAMRERRQRAISMFAGLSTIPPVAVWLIGYCIVLACRKYGAIRIKTAAVYLGSAAAFFCLWLGADDDRVDPFSDGQWLLLGCVLLAVSAVTQWRLVSRNA